MPGSYYAHVGHPACGQLPVVQGYAMAVTRTVDSDNKGQVNGLLIKADGIG